MERISTVGRDFGRVLRIGAKRENEGFMFDLFTGESIWLGEVEKEEREGIFGSDSVEGSGKKMK